MFALLLSLSISCAKASPVSAGPASGGGGSSAVTMDPAAAHARFEQLRAEMEKMAARNVWNGVEEAWLAMQDLGVDIPVDLRLLAADAARNRGDAWGAYQRLADVLRMAPESDVVAGQMRVYRENWGRVTVRRVEATAIPIAAVIQPLMPEGRAGIAFAQKELDKTGGFDGMLPVGDYTVGPYAFSVVAGLDPVLVQRVLGDGKK
jgi:hypothetical protein